MAHISKPQVSYKNPRQRYYRLKPWQSVWSEDGVVDLAVSGSGGLVRMN